MSAAIGTAVAVAGARAGATPWPGLAAAAALAVGLPGVLRPGAIEPFYIRWNRLARPLSRAARFGVTAICFLIVALVAYGGSRMMIRRPDPAMSAWLPWRGREAAAESAAASTAARLGYRRGAVFPGLLSWSRGPNAWVLGLLPFLLALRMLEPDRRGTVGRSVYTLY